MESLGAFRFLFATNGNVFSAEVVVSSIPSLAQRCTVETGW